MLMGKCARRAVAVVGVLAVALVGATVVGLWAGTAGPASADAELLEPAAAMDDDAGVCLGDLSEDLDSATPAAEGSFFTCPPEAGCVNTLFGCPVVACFPCCWDCGGGAFCRS